MEEERIVSRFRIIKEIGRGAMGIVYLAYDPVLDRNLALKELILYPNVSASEKTYKIKRFLREARAAGGLSHPNIVIVHDIAEADDKYYIAMEYLEGKTLSQVLSEGPMSIDRALEITTQLGSALSYAHSKDVVHRDIKPDNVFILNDGTVKITDFGIARMLTDTTMTRAGSAIGSPGYMSPEQIKGEKIDSKSDMFSLGVVLYEMITGKNPFEADSIHTAIYKIINETPPSFRELNIPASHELEEVVRKAMKKNPKERYADVKLFIRELGKVKETRPATFVEDEEKPEEKVDKKDKGKTEPERKKEWAPYLFIGLSIIIAVLLFLQILRPIFKYLRGTSSENGEARSEETVNEGSQKEVDERKDENLNTGLKEDTGSGDELTQEEIDLFASLDKRVPYRITASSELIIGDKRFGVENVVDGNKKTAWAEGVPGFGDDEWIQIEIGDRCTLGAIGMITGKLPEGLNETDEWENHGRVKAIEVQLSTGQRYKFTFLDIKRFQTRRIFPPVDISGGWVRIVLKDIYYPVSLDRSEDFTFITEIALFGKLE